MPKDRRKVIVTMPDGQTGQSTVSRLRRAFRGQSDLWKENFFYNLLNNGTARTDAATYAMQDWPAVAKTPPLYE